MNPSALRRASAVLLAILGVSLSCLQGASWSAHSCCSDEPCHAMLASTCCDRTSSLASAPSAGPALLVDRIAYVALPWVRAPRVAPVGRDSAVPLGIRTTVLRL
jgi:hypothetical protein